MIGQVRLSIGEVEHKRRGSNVVAPNSSRIGCAFEIVGSALAPQAICRCVIDSAWDSTEIWVCKVGRLLEFRFPDANTANYLQRLANRVRGRVIPRPGTGWQRIYSYLE